MEFWTAVIDWEFLNLKWPEKKVIQALAFVGDSGKLAIGSGLHREDCNCTFVFYVSPNRTKDGNSRYNKLLGPSEITLLIENFLYPGCKHNKIQRNFELWDQENYFVISGFCYISVFFITRVHCTSLVGQC